MQYSYIGPMKIHVFAFNFLFLSSTVPAIASMPPLPPDPASLEASRLLVEQLVPSDGGRWVSVANSLVVENAAKKSVAWADYTDPELLKDPELKRLFVGKVKQKVRQDAERLASTCIPEAKEAQAKDFAFRLSAADARDITSILTTKSGQALVPLISAEEFHYTLKICVYREIRPSLQHILDSARESNTIRKRVNSLPEREQ